MCPVPSGSCLGRFPAVRARVVQCQLEEHQTEPPQYLTESELITLMDRNGIGTDASIPPREAHA